MTTFSQGCWGLDSEPHGFITSAFTTKPSPSFLKKNSKKTDTERENKKHHINTHSLLKLSMVVHTWNHSTWKVESGGSESQCYPGLQDELKASQGSTRTCLENQKRCMIMNAIQKLSSLSLPAHELLMTACVSHRWSRKAALGGWIIT